MTSQKSSTDRDPIPLFSQLLDPSKPKANRPSPTYPKVDSSTTRSTLVTSRQPEKSSHSMSHTTSKVFHPATSSSAADQTTSTSLDPETEPSGPYIEADTVGSESTPSQKVTQGHDPTALSKMAAAMAQATEKATTSAYIAHISYTAATPSQVTIAHFIAEEERISNTPTVEQTREPATMTTEMEISLTTSQHVQIGSSWASADRDQVTMPTANEAAQHEAPSLASSPGIAAQAQETASVSADEFDRATSVVTTTSTNGSELEALSALDVAVTNTESVAFSTVTVSPVPFSSSVSGVQDDTPSLSGSETTALSVVILSPILAPATSAIAQAATDPVSNSANTRTSVVTLYPFPASSFVSGDSRDIPASTSRNSIFGLIHSMSAYKPSNVATSITYDTASEPQPTSESSADATTGPLASLMMSVMGQAHPSASKQSSEFLPEIVFDTSISSAISSTPATSTGSATQAIDAPATTDTGIPGLVPIDGTEASADSSVTETTGASSQPSESAFIFVGQGAQTRAHLSRLGLVLWVGIAVVKFAA